MNFNNLTEAQKARLRDCKSADEFAALDGEQGTELSDGQLEAVSAGIYIRADLEKK